MPKHSQQTVEPKAAEGSADVNSWQTELAMLLRNVNVLLVVMYTNKLRKEEK